MGRTPLPENREGGGLVGIIKSSTYFTHEVNSNSLVRTASLSRLVDFLRLQDWEQPNATWPTVFFPPWALESRRSPKADA